MEIAAILNVHTDPDVILDTLDSILCNLTEDVLVLIDGAKTAEVKPEELCVDRIRVPYLVGFRHGCPKSPYRNVALGLNCLFDAYPNAEWYCYTEYDVLFTSPRIRAQLVKASEMGVWMLGNDGHVDDKAIPLVESLIGEKLTSLYYLLGCCQFFHRDFMLKLQGINFFERFLNLTNEFSDGYMPAYDGYDVSEHMYASLCRQFGGNIGVLASYDEAGNWHGAYQHYPIRWRPELNAETEDFPEASIMHPLKEYDHPIRVKYREKRNGNMGLKSSRGGVRHQPETCEGRN